MSHHPRCAGGPDQYGGVITSAGVVLAATFAVFAGLPLVTMAQRARPGPPVLVAGRAVPAPGTAGGAVRQPDWELSFSSPQPCQRSTSIQALTRGRSRFGYGLPV